MGDGFAWTIPLIQGCFALLFLAARRAGAAPEAGCWAAGYALCAAAFTVSMLAPPLPAKVAVVVTDTLFACGFFVFGQALVHRYCVRDFRAARLVLLAAAIVLPASATIFGDTLGLELLATDIGCAVQVAVVLSRIRSWPGRRAERVMLAMSWFVVAVNVVRGISTPLTAADATFESFVDTGYSYLMYADGFVNGIAFGVLALVVVTTDLLATYRREAHVDPLTGLLNRRGFEVAVAAAGRPVGDGLIACDLDHFKRVNDRFGHDMGDRVLAAFADLVRAALPPAGIAARTGGEEFMLYLPGHSLVQTQAIAMRLSVAMAQHDWGRVGIGWRQTASFGIAERRDAAVPLLSLVRRADEALYDAKRGGRDRICGAMAA